MVRHKLAIFFLNEKKNDSLNYFTASVPWSERKNALKTWKKKEHRKENNFTNGNSASLPRSLPQFFFQRSIMICIREFFRLLKFYRCCRLRFHFFFFDCHCSAYSAQFFFVCIAWELSKLATIILRSKKINQDGHWTWQSTAIPTTSSPWGIFIEEVFCFFKLNNFIFKRKKNSLTANKFTYKL